jgi:two-component system NtrC family sensor kinase
MTKILIVDDEEPIRLLLKEILERENYDCTVAADATEARARLKEQNFELVISDIKMPGESGSDLIRYILAEYRDTATLIVSVMDDPSVAAQAFEIGVYGYLVKPFLPKGALISVSNALRRRQLEIDNRAYRQSLEQMVEERTTALHKSNKELEETVTRLKETQAQMIQSEKMASIGQLASGVAHEINNPTGFINSNLNTLADYQRDINTLITQYRHLIGDLKDMKTKGKCPPGLSEQLEGIVALEAELDIDFVLDDAVNLIGESQEGTERLKKIVSDLKDFAHPGKDQLESADINRCLESTLNVVWNELKYKAKVIKDYGELPLVECYPQQLNQVFMNLLVNAAQAIEKEGEIRIVTRALDGQVEVEINDTGSGIPKENLSKIFEPFFTTKEVGKGTGLGLHVVYDIVTKHKGTITVESEQGKGTAFKIRLEVEPQLQSDE